MDFTKLTPEQLNAISNQLDFLTQQIALMNQRSFGRKTEQLDQMQQLTLFDYFYEPELLCYDSGEPQINEITVSSHTRKAKSKREDNLEGLPARIFEHTLDDTRLAHLFPGGYKELPVEIYKRLSIIPQTLLVDEHHVHVYASRNNDGTNIKADMPADMFRNNIAAEATRRISELFHLDNQWDDLSRKDREEQRQFILKPRVDDFFTWAKSETQKLPAQSITRGGLQYCINQNSFFASFGTTGMS